MLRLAVLLLAVLGLATLLTPFTAHSARAEKVDLELVLAVDVSGSIDPYEARLQRIRKSSRPLRLGITARWR
jgi:hypothetical protein